MLAVVALVMFSVAVVVGRLAPIDRPTPVDVARSRPVGISPCVFRGVKPGERWCLDPDTGQASSMRVPASQVIDEASFSPWRDDQGGREVVGRWAHRSGSAENPLVDQVGLIRMSFPEGRVLDRVVTDCTPSSPPCWVPGARDTVLYAARDGRLVTLNFKPDPTLKVVPRPDRIHWAPELGNLGRVIVGDPIWPTDLRFNGRLIVSLYRFGTEPGDLFEPSGIWWLQLDGAMTTVVAAGRITPRPPVLSDKVAQVSRVAPAIATTPDGTPLLAYLEQDVRTYQWRLSMSPITFDAADGAPVARQAIGIDLPLSARPDRPVFSSDGRWLTLGLPTLKKRPQVFRIDTDAFRRDPSIARAELDQLAPTVERMFSSRNNQGPNLGSETNPARPGPPPPSPVLTLTATSMLILDQPAQASSRAD
jgi:hypothetical protein